jgi:hypothetical protein
MCDISIPLTRKVEDCRPCPAALVATQLYSPAFSACTDSMLKVLSLLLTRLTTTPFPLSTVLPLKIQNIVKGKSPLLIEHEADVISPELNCSSPKSKGKICGGTGKENQIKPNQKQYRSHSDMWKNRQFRPCSLRYIYILQCDELVLIL